MRLLNGRHTIRRQKVDYTKPNCFMVTICANKFGYYFEKYPELKKIIEDNLLKISGDFANTRLGEYVVMPNHIHFILTMRYQIKNVSLGKIIATFKSRVVTDWLKVINDQKLNSLAKIWQRNYHEHIIRNKDEFEAYTKYIVNNPKNWLNDSYHVSVK
ncbi:transposase [Candidatus Shapirobacteria bacterium]|nr:transposase [Candidatus Shapirobacteria bacterium]